MTDEERELLLANTMICMGLAIDSLALSKKMHDEGIARENEGAAKMKNLLAKTITIYSKLTSNATVTKELAEQSIEALIENAIRTAQEEDEI